MSWNRSALEVFTVEEAGGGCAPPDFHLRLLVKEGRSLLSCSALLLTVQCSDGYCVLGPRGILISNTEVESVPFLTAERVISPNTLRVSNTVCLTIQSVRAPNASEIA